ncbi:PH domain-containing protein [Niallia oryzisoli]|uniref:PH domain-containing protein n=1 Tax=Niallia oryzisoli TaxID=1737571 RepID=UPI0037368FC6
MWNIKDIQEVELLAEMPEVTIKSNGFATGTIAKGIFRVNEYGSSLLFIQKQPPYLYIKVKNQPIFINGESPDETREWYNKVISKTH